MFGNLEGFQDIYQSVSPTDLIKFVNHTISTFDKITDHYEVYKVNLGSDHLKSVKLR